jgi:2-polyprenyl-6-methoxyphenol hydroxylase-like FAD-dependent oxidoreductase
VTVFERVDDPQAVGAGIVLQPTGLQVLHELGLASHLLSRGACIDRLWAMTWKNKTVVDLHYDLISSQYFGLGIHRGALFKALFDAVQAHDVPIHCGVDVVDVRGADGPEAVLIDAKGQEYGPFGLVIVGAGSRTDLRDTLNMPHRCRKYPWGALWAIEEDKGGVFTNEKTLLQYVRGAKYMLGFLPTGLGPTGDVPLVSLYWSIHSDRIDRWRSEGLDAWKAEVLSADPRAEPVLDQVHSLDEIVYGPYLQGQGDLPGRRCPRHQSPTGPGVQPGPLRCLGLRRLHG